MNFTFTWGAFIVYSLAMLYIGYVGMRKTKTSEDYYVSGRGNSLFVQVPLYAASFISAVSIISYTGFSYANGWSLLLMYGTGCAGGWIMLQLISGRIYNTNFEYNTSADYYCARYYEDKGYLRGFMGIFNMLMMFLYVVVGLTGIGTLLEVFLNTNYVLGVFLAAVVFLAYTVMGGSYSVTWTNVVQFILLFVGIIITAFTAVRMVGGISTLNAAISAVQGPVPNFMHDFIAGGNLTWTKMIGVSIGIIFMCPVASYYHRIFFSSRSKKVCGSFIGVSAIFLMITYTGLCLIGLSTRVLAPGITLTEQAFPTLVMMLPGIFSALALFAIISAIQSTMDSQLLTAASMVSNDIYKKLVRPEATEDNVMKVARNATLAIGIAATIISMIRPAMVIDIYNFIMVIAPTVLFPPFILGLFWKRTTREAAVFGSTFGVVAGLLWSIFGPKQIPCTLVIMPLNLILMIIVSLRTPAPPKEIIDKFFVNETV